MNKLQSNQISHRLNDNLIKLQSSDDKMRLLNFIRQEENKTIHYKIEKDKFKSVMKDLLKHVPHDSEELHESQESQESSSELEEKNEVEQIENNLDFADIYENNKSGETINYDPNHAKIQTVAKIMYSQHKLDQLIKKKKW